MLTRKVIAADAADISRLSYQLGYNFSIEETAIQIAAISNSANDVAYVAIDNNKAAGWIHVFYTMRLECNSYCEIGGLVIDEQYRGKGVGRMLIEQIKPWCLLKHCKELRVRSNIKRTEAHQFYEHLGFLGTKQQKVFRIILNE